MSMQIGSMERIGELVKILQNHVYESQQLEEIFAEAQVLLEDVRQENEANEAISSLCYFSGVYFLEKQDFANAIAYLSRSLEINRRVYTEDHPYTAAAYSNLGDVFMETEEVDKAVDYYARAIEISTPILGEQAPFTVINYFKLGTAYGMQGFKGKAIGYFTKAMVALEENVEGPTDILAETYLSLGEIYQDIGAEEYGSAITFYQKSLKVCLQMVGDGHEICGYIRERIVECKQGLAAGQQ